MRERRRLREATTSALSIDAKAFRIRRIVGRLSSRSPVVGSSSPHIVGSVKMPPSVNADIEYTSPDGH
jgi:hypothetical protein